MSEGGGLQRRTGIYQCGTREQSVFLLKRRYMSVNTDKSVLIGGYVRARGECGDRRMNVLRCFLRATSHNQLSRKIPLLHPAVLGLL
jgi:hypothetical protein